MRCNVTRLQLRPCLAKKEGYEIDPSSTVEDLKRLIDEKEGTETEGIILLYRRKKLKNDDILENRKIIEGSNIIMALKMGNKKLRPANSPSFTNEANQNRNALQSQKDSFIKRIKIKMRQNRKATATFGTTSTNADANTFFPAIKSARRLKIEERVSKLQAKRAPPQAPATVTPTITDTVTSIPTASASDDEDSKLTDLCQSKKRRGKILVSVSVVIIAIVIVIGIFYFRAEEKEPTTAPTLSEAPTQFPSLSSFTPPVNFDLIDKLIVNNISKPEEFNTEDSLQMDALMKLWNQNANKSNIIQQYVLALVFCGLGANDFIEDFENNSECSWQSIECSDDGTVTKIILNNKELRGNIITEIGVLADITEIDLGANSLVGTIPSSIGEMTYLETIKLYRNRLTGTIPETFNNLTSLVSIEIQRNDLMGTIPSGIWTLKHLKKLVLYRNKFAFSLPDTLGELESLVYLDLTFIFQMVGTIPTSIGKLSNLEFLHIGDSGGIGGTIPTEFGLLRNLKDFYFGFTNIEGTLPSELGNLKHIESFVLRENLLTGSLPSELGSMKKIKSLELQAESISGTIPKEMNFTTLEDFIVCHTDMVGSIPSEWCTNSKESKANTRFKCDCCSKCDAI